MDAAAPATIALTIRAPLRRRDLPGLCERVCDRLAGTEGGWIHCDVAGIAADAVAVDALARLQLAARRHRCRVRLRHASADLVALVAWLGLEDVLAS